MEIYISFCDVAKASEQIFSLLKITMMGNGNRNKELKSDEVEQRTFVN